MPHVVSSIVYEYSVIEVRETSSLNAQITCSESECVLTIDTSAFELGTYQLVIESFEAGTPDPNKIARKTDTI